MKQFLVTVFAILGFTYVTDAQDLTPESVKRRLDRSDSRIEHPKQSQNAKTWVDRGVVFQDIFDVNIQFLYFGMSPDEARLFMGNPKEIRTEQSDAGVREVHVYENIELFFEGGQLTGWHETEVIHESPLEEAYSAYLRAIELEESGEGGGGFFSRLFGGSQERRISSGMTRLHGQFISQAVLQYEEQDFGNAFNSFRKSIEIAETDYYEEPLDTGLVFNTGFVAALAGMHEESLDYLNRAKDMGYGEGSIYVLIKEAYIELGDSTNAEQILQEGFSKFPNDNAILVELTNFYINAGKPNDALSYLDRAKQQEPDNPSFHYAEGALYDQMGEPDKALEAYRRALAIDPDMRDANYNLGVFYYNRAVVMLEKANEIMDNREYEKARDEAFEVLADAIPYLEHAHRVDPDHMETMDILRIIYYRLGMEEKLDEMNKKLGREVLE